MLFEQRLIRALKTVVFLLATIGAAGVLNAQTILTTELQYGGRLDDQAFSVATTMDRGAVHMGYHDDGYATFLHVVRTR